MRLFFHGVVVAAALAGAAGARVGGAAGTGGPAAGGGATGRARGRADRHGRHVGVGDHRRLAVAVRHADRRRLHRRAAQRRRRSPGAAVEPRGGREGRPAVQGVRRRRDQPPADAPADLLGGRQHDEARLRPRHAVAPRLLRQDQSAGRAKPPGARDRRVDRPAGAGPRRSGRTGARGRARRRTTGGSARRGSADWTRGRAGRRARVADAQAEGPRGRARAG